MTGVRPRVMPCALRGSAAATEAYMWSIRSGHGYGLQLWDCTRFSRALAMLYYYSLLTLGPTMAHWSRSLIWTFRFPIFTIRVVWRDEKSVRSYGHGHSQIFDDITVESDGLRPFGPLFSSRSDVPNRPSALYSLIQNILTCLATRKIRESIKQQPSPRTLVTEETHQMTCTRRERLSSAEHQWQ